MSNNYNSLVIHKKCLEYEKYFKILPTFIFESYLINSITLHRSIPPLLSKIQTPGLVLRPRLNTGELNMLGCVVADIVERKVMYSPTKTLFVFNTNN